MNKFLSDILLSTEIYEGICRWKFRVKLLGAVAKNATIGPLAGINLLTA
jgi:hypothetical protein